MTVAATDVRLYTVETIPVVEYIGAVTFWARHESPDVAERRALAGLRERASGLGADAVVGLRVQVHQEIAIGSESRPGSTIILVSSVAAYRVDVAGTAARRST